VAELSWNQMLASMQLIGELFNIQIVTPKIAHSCIRRLLTEVVTPLAGDMEACCVLLATVGNTLDQPRDAKGGCRYVDEYFERIEHIAMDEENSLNQRLRCLLLDLVALRKVEWSDEGKSMLSKLLSRKGEETFQLPKKKKRRKKRNILGPNGEVIGTETCSDSAGSGVTDGSDTAPDSPVAGEPTAYGAALLVRMSGKGGLEGAEGSGGEDNLPWPGRLPARGRNQSVDSTATEDDESVGVGPTWCDRRPIPIRSRAPQRPLSFFPFADARLCLCSFLLACLLWQVSWVHRRSPNLQRLQHGPHRPRKRLPYPR